MSRIRLQQIFLVGALVLVAGGRVHADDPQGVCIWGARQYTCPDGSVIDACDDCSSGGSSGGGNNNSGAGMIKFVGMMIGVAIFVPGFVISPAFALEVWWSLFDKELFGNKAAAVAAAKEAFEKYREDQVDIAKLGKEIETANIEIDHDDIIRDALNAGYTVKHDLPRPAGMWWANMPRLQPNLDIACKSAGMEYPFHMFASDPIGIFANSGDMLNQCDSRIEKPKLSSDADATGRCTAPGAMRCMHVNPANGLGVCCPQGQPIFNAADASCYRDTDFRGASRFVAPYTSVDDARRFLGGEYCPAYSP